MISEAIVVYWRPGCGFCMNLERKLAKAGVTYERRNIWDDDDHAAFVRSVANGNETVPTVVVGTSAMVNPSWREVVAAAAGPLDQLDESAGPEEPKPRLLDRLRPGTGRGTS